MNITSRITDTLIKFLVKSSLGVRITRSYLHKLSESEFDRLWQEIRLNRITAEHLSLSSFSVVKPLPTHYEFKMGVAAAPAIQFSEEKSE